MNAAPGLFLCLLGAVLMSGQLEAVFVPLRCTCLEVTEVVKKPLIDIKVIEKGPHCENTEIIVTLKTQAGDGLPSEVCLNPSGKQAKRLQQCLKWAKSNKEKKRCLQPQKRRRGQKRKRKQAQK